MVAQFTAEHYQRRPARLRIDLDGGDRISLPIPQTVRPPAPDEGTAGVEADLAAEIFDVLADTGKRHTREEMVLALPERSESAVHKALWMLRKAGKLSHRKDSCGLGFGLPEWA